MNELNDYADYNYYLEGPEVFLDLVRKAKLVIANSFHAVAFSILYQKEFMVFNRTEAINTTMRDLINSFKIECRLLDKDDIISIEKLIPIDYDAIKNEIENQINHSKLFLRTALSNMTE